MAKMTEHQQGESRTSSSEVNIALMIKDIQIIKEDVSEIKTTLKVDYVTYLVFNDLKERVNTLDTRFWAVIILSLSSLISALTALILALINRGGK